MKDKGGRMRDEGGRRMKEEGLITCSLLSSGYCAIALAHAVMPPLAAMAAEDTSSIARLRKVMHAPSNTVVSTSWNRSIAERTTCSSKNICNITQEIYIYKLVREMFHISCLEGEFILGKCVNI